MVSRIHTKIEQSVGAFERSKQLFPGGVNSPVRAYGAVGGTPRFVERAEGPHIYDLDGQKYIDYVGSWGPMILGHVHPAVITAVVEALKKGSSFGAPTEMESELAERVMARLPSIEVLRFVSSGTEAVMSALRAARGFTGRDLVVKCSGCYHGHADGLLVAAGSGAATFGTPSSAGVSTAAASGTIVAPFNDLAAARRIFEKYPEEIAGFVVEPVAGNMGVVAPEPGYLEGLRELCDANGSLLLFDEVMTGFRVGMGGAQTLYDVWPDLTALGKIIGGGLPAAAYGGRAEIMRKISPDGPVYQAGTLSGNPLAMAAGIATLDQLAPESYERLETLGARLEAGLRALSQPPTPNSQPPFCVQRVGSMITLFLAPGPIRNFEEAQQSDTARYAKFFHGMLERGIWLPPSQFEAWFIGLAHNEELIDQTIAAAKETLAEIG